MRRWSALVAVGACSLAGCTASRTAARPPGIVRAVATINAWGSLLAQLGGAHAHVTSLITNPATDPHDYEPTPADARAIADAQLVVDNGVGYDPWAAKVLTAEPDGQRIVLDVGRTTGTQDDGNPHRWYSPGDVDVVLGAMSADLSRADPRDAPYFAAQLAELESKGFATYHRLIEDIRRTYAGTPIGASESIISPLADALGLDVRTPGSFLRAISEGSDPSAADKAAIDHDIAQRRIAVYVFNSQNGTPDVTAQVDAARGHGIPVVAVTETLSPAGATFEQWQVAQLEALRRALHQATGR